MLPMTRAWLVVLAACSSPPAPREVSRAVRVPGALLAPEDFAHLADPAQRAAAIFDEMARVFTHPRCANCHPADDSPRQGDRSFVHDPPVVRGPEDRGIPALRCTTCHQDANATLARIPGAPDWHLAPIGMAWLGRTPSEICHQLLDPQRNGHRDRAQLLEHVAHDKLVAWGWAPGADRAPAPGSQTQLAELFSAWIKDGAGCP